MSGPERSFRTNKVLPFLKKLKNTVIFPVSQVSIVGTPDYLLCVRGKFVGLELKAPGGRLSKLQAHFLNEILRCGGEAMVAEPSTWDDIKAKLEKLDAKN